MRFVIEAFGDEIVSRELLRVKDRAMDARPAFEAIHSVFLGAESHQFATEGGLNRWTPLAASTVAYKARHGLDPRILHATLRLRNSLASGTSGDHIFRVTSDSAFMGSSVPYGVYHQSTRPRSHLPRRPPVDLDEATKRNWIKILQDYIMTGLIRPGVIA